MANFDSVPYFETLEEAAEWLVTTFRDYERGHYFAFLTDGSIVRETMTGFVASKNGTAWAIRQAISNGEGHRIIFGS